MRFETSIVIHRPIDEVWSFVADPFNIPRWNPSWLELRTPSGAVGIGSTGQGRWRLLGFETRMVATITEWDPPRAAMLSIVGAGLRSGTLGLTLEPTAEGTRLVRWSDLEPRPIMRPVYAILGRIFGNRANQKLKRLLEADPG